MVTTMMMAAAAVVVVAIMLNTKDDAPSVSLAYFASAFLLPRH